MRRMLLALVALSFALLPMSAATASAAPRPDTTAPLGVMVSDPVHPDGTHVCASGYLCVHEEIATNSWKWYDYRACGYWHPIHGAPTWYVNNQVDGAVGIFLYPDGTEWYTPKPVSRGRPLHYPYDSPKLTQPTQVMPCR